jgi:hypothetical protein
MEIFIFIVLSVIAVGAMVMAARQADALERFKEEVARREKEVWDGFYKLQTELQTEDLQLRKRVVELEEGARRTRQDISDITQYDWYPIVDDYHHGMRVRPSLGKLDLILQEVVKHLGLCLDIGGPRLVSDRKEKDPYPRKVAD